MRRKNRVLFNNNLSINEWKEELESYKENLRDNQDVSEESINKLDIYDLPFQYWVEDNLNWLYEDMKEMYDYDLPTKIIVFADLGFWNGRKFGSKVLNYNLNECFAPEEGCDYVKWELNAFDLISTQVHHDGTHYLTYRRLKDDKYQDLLMRKAYSGELTKRDIARYTISLKHTIERMG